MSEPAPPQPAPPQPAPPQPAPPQPSDVARCSAKGCRAEATTDLSWRNPRLHDAARVKHWAACDEHAVTLGQYLEVRGFLLGRAGLPA